LIGWVVGAFLSYGGAKGVGGGGGGVADGCEEEAAVWGSGGGGGGGGVEVGGEGWWIGVTREGIGSGVGFARNVDDGEVVFG